MRRASKSVKIVLCPASAGASDWSPLAHTELLPPELETRTPAAPPTTPPAPDRSVFASMDRMQVKRDPKSTAIAIGIHALMIGLIAYFVATKTNLITPSKPMEIALVAPPPPPPKAPPKAVVMGGGGGQKSTPVAKGTPPPPDPHPLNPPKAPPLDQPKINIPVKVDIDPTIKMASSTPNLGLASSPLVGVGLGTGKGTGIGNGNGSGIGPGSGGNTGGGPKRIGGGVSAPVPLYTPEPEFSEEARKAKVAGNVLVYLQVDTNGRPTHVRVIRGIGLGLDEKAMEAVRQYKFKPAMENGHPVLVEMNVEVNFQIF